MKGSARGTRSVLTVILLVSLAACAQPVTEPSAILIVVDTLRADHLGTYGYHRPTSPNLDDWAKEGRVFERAHSTSPWTLPTFGSLYTGYLPLRHRAGMTAAIEPGVKASTNRLSRDVYPIAQQLTDNGVHTGAVANNPFLGPPFGLARGFEVYDHVPGGNRTMRRADETVTRALELVDSWSGAPFFLVVHLFDPHMSYDAPPPFRGTFTDAYDSQLVLPVEDIQLLRQLRTVQVALTDTDWEFVRAAYDEEIAFVDEQLGKLRAGLAARGVLDSSLIVLTSDHGEELSDHGSFEHGHTLWQELLRVPLVFWGPGVVPGRETAPVSLADVAPTILEWMDAAALGDLDGRSLWENLSRETPIADRTLIAEGLLYGDPQTAILRWPLKLVVDSELQPLRAVDLDADPLEAVDLLPAGSAESPALAELLRARVKAEALRVQFRDAFLPEASPELEEADPETLERLRSLGYLR